MNAAVGKLRVMRRIKVTFDEHGSFNPDRIFRRSQNEPAKVRR
jgi:hypothetical protein